MLHRSIIAKLLIDSSESDSQTLVAVWFEEMRKTKKPLSGVERSHQTVFLKRMFDTLEAKKAPGLDPHRFKLESQSLHVAIGS